MSGVPAQRPGPYPRWYAAVARIPGASDGKEPPAELPGELAENRLRLGRSDTLSHLREGASAPCSAAAPMPTTLRVWG